MMLIEGIVEVVEMMMQNLAVMPEVHMGKGKETFQELLSWENLYMTEAPHPMEVQHYEFGDASYELTLTYLLKPVLVAACLMFLTIVAVLLTGPMVHPAF